MQKSLSKLFVFLTFNLCLNAQTLEKHDYHPPLKIPLILASNFGELRPNHFHMGLDFKTNGKEGYNLYSIEDGFVSRIKVSTYGYGKAIYIDHPNGITSVYAHCSEFKDQIDSLVRSTQKREGNFEIDISLKKNEINVKRGQIIGISGNSGGSTAPHLHFELRDTKTEHALNPLVYGFDIADTKAPEIRGVKVYGLTKDGYRFPDKAIRRTTIKSGNDYVISENLITVPASYLSKTGGIGFAFDVIDRLDGAANQCGMFGGTLIVNNDTIFGQETKRVPFEATRFVNCHKDYEEYSISSRKFHKSFKTKENDLPIYTTEGLGVIWTTPGALLHVQFISYDVKENRSELKFDVKIAEGDINPSNEIYTSNVANPDSPIRMEKDNTTVDFGLSTVYEPMKVNKSMIDKTIGDANQPVNNAYLIKIKSSEKKDGKHYLEMITEKGRRKELTLTYDDSTFYCRPKYFGSHSVKRDITPPTVTSINFTTSTTVITRTSLQWRISDTQIGIDDYDLFIDNEWVLVEYDYKSSLVTHKRDASFIGTKELKFIVKDKCGNSTEWKSTIEFK
jgi:hypothetical protein